MNRRRVPVRTTAGDALQAYRAKRDFARTPEPAAGGEPGAGGLSFVVQKHWASHLHYDFRLEFEGTMKSWAVPKGPSLDPAVKRMAVQVEDHPLAYADFEGQVPAGQYGAGKVIVWDAGTWRPLGDPAQGWADGNLKFELQGRKLNGRWVLVRMKGRGEKQVPWLLIKEKDAAARAAADYDVLDEAPDSVKPPRSLPGLPAGAVPCALPRSLSPQLAVLAGGLPPDAAGWLYEIKFDGYRLLVRQDDAGARLWTRNGQDWSAKLSPLQVAFEGLGLPAGWYDGELVVQDATGLPDFGALQQALKDGPTDTLVLYLFDLPYAAGHDLRSVPLQARRHHLQGLLARAKAGPVRFSEAFDADPASVMASACQLGLEGVIAKRRDSLYRSSRSTDWIKLKCGLRQEFVIGGYTAAQGARKGFGALLLGVYDAQGALRYAGNVGSGFTEQALKDLRKALDARLRKTSPFAAGAGIEGKPTWVAPTLVAEVSFGQWTRAGRLRHAVFRGLRADKEAGSIMREKVVQAGSVQALGVRPAVAARGLPGALRVTHGQRVIDERSGTTKLELVRYYGLVGGLMMKHLKGRPVSLVRAPAGVEGALFFQKHVAGETLAGIRQLDPALSAGHPPLIEVAGRPGLLSAAQWNVIEFHTQNGSGADPGHPDRMVFDLDPGEGVPWVRLREAAELVKGFLDRLGLASFLKTSGGKGLHVVVPVKRQHDAATVKAFSRAVVAHMARTLPKRFVVRSGPSNRVGRIFIDYLRNGPGATTVCAWSARARPGLGISVPLSWDELPALRAGDQWTVKTVHERLDRGNEPWRGYARAARGLAAAMAALGHEPASA